MTRNDGIVAPEVKSASTRCERDSFGDIDVPMERLWGAQTQRAIEHFRISVEVMPREIIAALAAIKAECAAANSDLGLLDRLKADAIAHAAEEILGGLHPDEFPLSVWQSGSGTQTNMNINEVIANRSSELLGGQRGMGRLVHPNDDVNLGQSSNDVVPTAMHVSASLGVTHRVLPALRCLHATMAGHADAFAGIIKIGRTHLQDAIPMTLGQEFSGYAAQLLFAEHAINRVIDPLLELPLGGTAVGTGFNTCVGFAERVISALSLRMGLPLRRASNAFSAIAAHDALVSAHGALKTLATALIKIANDVRWLASGPRSGLGEITLPPNEPGSSMMPGKVNPTQCEAMIMVCFQIMANDLAIGLCGASGNFELNACKPLIANAFLQSVRLLSDSMIAFERFCARGIAADRRHIAELLERSLMLVTALSAHLGYDRSAEIAGQAYRTGTSLREAAIASGHVTATDFDLWVRPQDMLGPAKRP
jgi:fumarate hydratase class II